MNAERSQPISLPAPELAGGMALVEALQRRRSVREFDGSPLTLAELGQLLWAAQGTTGAAGLRNAPSAGALFPVELFAVTQGSAELEAGIYHYLPRCHGLEPIAEGDALDAFLTAATGQDWITRAGAVLVVAAAYGRTTAKYGERGRRYVAIEAGHCVQNVYLQAVTLRLGATEVGAFDDDAVARLLRLPHDQAPVTSIAVGRWP